VCSRDTTEVPSMVIIQHDGPGGDTMSRSTTIVTNAERASLMRSLPLFTLAGRGKAFSSLAPGPSISAFGNLSNRKSDCNNKAMEIDVHLDPIFNESGIEAERSVVGYGLRYTPSH
jgi:hypothetical protein